MPITNPYEFIPDELQKRLLLERRSDELEVTQEEEDSQARKNYLRETLSVLIGRSYIVL